jgi:peptidoglycan/xylan/chitin deacetylase (PgdA/CDA1 family)
MTNRIITTAALLLVAGAAAGAQQEQHSRTPNTNGRIPVLEYHLVGEKDSRWGRSAEHFRRDLELLYKRGYRPITVAQLVDGDIDMPAGMSPVVFTFDDASPGQFKYIEKNGGKEIDPQSGVGVWLAFNKEHPDWKNRATFCLLSGAAAGHAFFGEKGIEGQKTAWRFEKLKFLADNGFELCAHTLWHANLGKYSDAVVQEQIARSVLAIDSAVTGYKVRTFALPLGVWPKNRALATAGSWRDPKTKRDVGYKFDAVLEVSGPSVPSPASPSFKPYSLTRVQVVGNSLEEELDRLDAKGIRFVSAGAGRLERHAATP